MSSLRQFLSALVQKHTSLFVLLALCAYYSIMTWEAQFPSDAAAGRKLGSQIISSAGQGATALVIVRQTQLDRAFASSLKETVESRGGTVAVYEVLSPAEARTALLSGAQIFSEIDVVATHETCSLWGPLKPDRIKQLAIEHPALKTTQLMKPDCYYWPSFLTRQNLLNVLNQNADIAILAIGMTMVIIAAGIDLSVGSVLALSGVVTAVTIEGLAGSSTAGTVAICAAA